MSLRRDLQALVLEYEESKCNPAPYTSERALYERVHALAFPSVIQGIPLGEPLCDGCNVHDLWEHRCHGFDVCPCEECHEEDPLPLHRTAAGYPNCSTCAGSGCLDCTDPA